MEDGFEGLYGGGGGLGWRVGMELEADFEDVEGCDAKSNVESV